MSPPESRKSTLIRANRVQVLDHPILMGGDPGTDGALTVTPVLEGEVIRVLRIRCSCGQKLDVECVYSGSGVPEAGTEDPETDPPSSEVQS